MKIAIFGGAFNPVHNEHINCAIAAKSELGLDKIIIMPSFISPHKSGSLSARAKDRLSMCRLAFGGPEGFEVSDYEIKKGGVSYSYLTCRRFKKLYPDDELYFIIGADSLKGFKNWKEPQDILKNVTLAVCARESAEELKPLVSAFYRDFKREIVSFGYVGKGVSSTKVRTLAALGEDISALVPEAVKKYIKDKNLYYLPEIAKVRDYLTPQRWEHTVGVALLAAANCRRAGVYEYDAIVASALHDCAKYLSLSSPELSGFTPSEGVPPSVMHQYTGAFVAEHTFGVTDKAVLNAIRYHTSGRENASALDKLLYLADMLEEGRDFAGVEELRNYLAKDINLCYLKALEHQLNYLKSRGERIYPLTQRALDFIKENL